MLWWVFTVIIYWRVTLSQSWQLQLQQIVDCPILEVVIQIDRVSRDIFVKLVEEFVEAPLMTSVLFWLLVPPLGPPSLCWWWGVVILLIRWMLLLLFCLISELPPPQFSIFAYWESVLVYVIVWTLYSLNSLAMLRHP